MLEEEDSVSSDRKQFRLWATGCSHVHTDRRWNRLSLADAITDSEEGGDEGGQSFDWDIMLHLGDLKGNQVSRLLIFADGSDTVNVKCYLHTSHYAPEGWYSIVEKNIKLSRPFRIQTDQGERL